MPTVSPSNAFVDALRYGSTLMSARLSTYVDGVPTGSQYVAPVSTGSFTIDRNAEQRRTGQISLVVTASIPPSDLVPTSPASLFAPFGNEVFVEVGITGTGNTAVIQWVPMGLYAIETSDADDTTNNLVVTLSLQDRSWTIAQRALKQPYNVPATPSGNFAAEIVALLTQVWNQQLGVAPLQFNIAPTSQVVPQASYQQGSDPWQAALDMAAAVGYELFFSVAGVVTAYPIPNPYTTAPCWAFTDDETAILGYGGTGGSTSLFNSPYSTPVEVQVQMTRNGITNDQIVEGTGTANAATYNGSGLQVTGPPILAEAADTNPQSPTYIAGPMGDVPNFIQSSLVTAQGAQQMANTQLQASLSAAWTVTLSIPPNPIFDVDDVVTITRPRVGLNATPVVIDTITATLTYADQTQMTGRVLA